MKAKTVWKVIFLSGIGGMLEFYDFVIFAIFAYQLGIVFFPADSTSLSTVYAFGIFAAGYLARPIGGIIFGHFGDRYGRKTTFAVSISLMAISTLLMGLIPGYHIWGVTAVILFLLLRIIQGLAIGGEIPGAITFVYEHVKSSARIGIGILFFFINCGILLASIVYTLIYHLLPLEIANSYGWRIAFIFGSVLAIIGYYLRKRLDETPEFVQFENRLRPAIPVVKLFKEHAPSVLAGSCLMVLMATVISMVLLYLVPYLENLGTYSVAEISRLHLFGLIVLPIFIIFWNYIAEKGVAQTKLYTWIVICFIVLLIPLFYEVAYHRYEWISYCILIILSAGIAGLSPVILAENFPVSVRYSGVAFGYNIAYAVFGGLTPLIASWMYYENISHIAPAWLLVIASIIGLFGLALGFRYQKLQMKVAT
ncbi:MFS transporter [Thiotrichales bacterium 19S3-7]|nr:MFS transporter [Thiotrichales bacterium 19S3-7]MCF6802380.1 MFS transporter [Thiotrichales bacterium 19S3-11]